MSNQQEQGQERELLMLAGIGAFVTWCEELLAILSGPILTAGLAIALVALLTDGQLLVSVPALLWVWAISQAIGLDAQFIGAAAKLARAIRQRRVWPSIGYAVLCGALGYVAYIASNVFATQEANGITTAEALGRLGMDSTSWIVQRSLLAVILVFLSGFLRYVAPAQDLALSAKEEKAKLQAELELEPLRAQKRAMQMRGWRGVGAALLGNETPDRPPTGGGTPQQQPPVEEQVEEPAQQAANVVQLPRTSGKRRTAARGRARGTYRKGLRNPSVEVRARAAWDAGNRSVPALEKAAGISRSSAQKYHAKFNAEGQAAQ